MKVAGTLPRRALPLFLALAACGLNFAPRASAFDISFSYLFDTQGFFDDPVRKATLEAAGDFISSFIGESMTAINPSGVNSWTATFSHPGTGRNQSLINRAYCISNPLGHEGYNEFVWGLTASDDPLVGYLAHEPQVSRDNGTMAPTGALSAMPYTPTQSIATLKYYYRQLGHRLWGPMGFYDAFHLGLDWYADSYLAIDQGPIICMIENYRTQLLWNHFMANPEIQDALDAIGFVPDTTVVATETPSLSSGIDLSAYPNPAQDKLMMELAVAKNTGLSATLLDSKGNLVIQLIDGRHFAPGNYTVPIDTRRLSNGVYFLQVRTEQTALTRRIMILK